MWPVAKALGHPDMERHQGSSVGPHGSRPGFDSLPSTGIWGQIILGFGGYPVSCRVFSGIPSLHPSCGNQKCLQTATCPLGEKMAPQVLTPELSFISQMGRLRAADAQTSALHISLFQSQSLQWKGSRLPP